MRRWVPVLAVVIFAAMILQATNWVSLEQELDALCAVQDKVREGMSRAEAEAVLAREGLTFAYESREDLLGADEPPAENVSGRLSAMLTNFRSLPLGLVSQSKVLMVDFGPEGRVAAIRCESVFRGP